MLYVFMRLWGLTNNAAAVDHDLYTLFVVKYKGGYRSRFSTYDSRKWIFEDYVVAINIAAKTSIMNLEDAKKLEAIVMMMLCESV